MVSAGAYRAVSDDDTNERRRVVITGLGTVTAAGPTLADLWSALCDKRLCTAPLTRFDAPRPAAAGQIADDWRGPSDIPDWLLKRMDRASQLALDAAIQAQTDARIVFNQQNAFAVGAISGIAHPDRQGLAAFGSGLSGASVGLNIAGPVFTVEMGGASGLASVVLAAQLIRSGVIRAALAIGAEAPLRQDVWNAYESAGLLDPSDDPAAQRPFDANRQGMILGEGAAALMLEDRQLATQRGVHIYAEIAGEALSSGPIGDGLAPTDVEIARRATGDALLGGEIAPADIDVVVAAGLGSKQGDERETDIIERALRAAHARHVRDRRRPQHRLHGRRLWRAFGRHGRPDRRPAQDSTARDFRGAGHRLQARLRPEPLRRPDRRRGDGGVRGARSERGVDPDAAPSRSGRRVGGADQLRSRSKTAHMSAAS